MSTKKTPQNIIVFILRMFQGVLLLAVPILPAEIVPDYGTIFIVLGIDGIVTLKRKGAE